MDNDDIKDEYGDDQQGENSREANNEEYDINEKSIIEEHDFECYECQFTFSKLSLSFFLIDWIRIF